MQLLLTQRSRTSIVSVLVLFYLLRLVIPYGNHLLVPYQLFVAAIAICYLLRNRCVVDVLKSFTRNYFIPIIVLIISIIFFIFFSDHHKILTIDFAHAINAFVVIFIIYAMLQTKDDLYIFFSKLRVQIIAAAGIVATLGLVKLMLMFKGITIPFLAVVVYPKGSSLTFDGNFFSLFLLLAMVLLFKSLFQKNTPRKSLLYQLVLFVISACALLTLSRRGLLVLAIICSAIFIMFLISVFKRNGKLYFFKRNVVFYLSAVCLVGVLLGCYLFVATPLKRNEMLLNSSFTQSLSDYFTSFVYETRSIYDDKASYYDVKKNMWEGEFDSRYPYSGWGRGEYTPVYELTGDSCEMVPKGSVGYKIDKQFKSSAWNGNAHFYSLTFSHKINPHKVYTPYVYCYVSEDFNGDRVFLNGTSKTRLRGSLNSFYDLSQKGKWQKLQISTFADSGIFDTYLYAAKYNAQSFDSLTGYFIFAYPSIDSLDFSFKNPITWMQRDYTPVYPLRGRNVEIVPDSTIGVKVDRNTGPFTTDKYVSGLLEYETEAGTGFYSSIYCYVSPDFNGGNVRMGINGTGIISYDIVQRGSWQKLEIISEGMGNKISSYFAFDLPHIDSINKLEGYVIFAYPQFGKKDLAQLGYNFNEKTGSVAVVFPVVNNSGVDPKDPLSWSSRPYVPSHPLYGNNAGIVPRGSIGLRIDRNCGATASNKFVNRLLDFKTELGRNYISSIYCYVSPDFNGEKVRIGTYGSGVVMYNMNRKGSWQKLEVNSVGNGYNSYSYIAFEKPDAQSLSWLSGYVIFAYPDVDDYSYNPKKVRTYAPNNQCKIVAKLQGKNVGIVPYGSEGLLLDKDVSGNDWRNVFYSVCRIIPLNTNEGDSVRASIFCYESADFNGFSRIEAHGKEGVVPKRCTNYDSKRRGTWQRLESKTVSSGGEMSIDLFVGQRDVKDFSTLEGHVIFAYPEFWVKKNGKWSPYEELTRTVSSNINIKKILPPAPKKKDNVIPVKQDSRIEVDTTKATSVSDTVQFGNIDNVFAGPRVERWRYAWYIFSTEYKWWQRIIGGGFGYTKKFANVFKVETGFDYPHNPMISVLLYSGVLGLLLYLWILVDVFRYYWRYRKEHWQWMLCFYITFFFAFFSANGPFDPAVMGFFTLLPYFINHIHQTEPTSSSQLDNI